MPELEEGLAEEGCNRSSAKGRVNPTDIVLMPDVQTTRAAHRYISPLKTCTYAPNTTLTPPLFSKIKVGALKLKLSIGWRGVKTPSSIDATASEWTSDLVNVVFLVINFAIYICAHIANTKVDLVVYLTDGPCPVVIQE